MTMTKDDDRDLEAVRKYYEDSFDDFMNRFLKQHSINAAGYEAALKFAFMSGASYAVARVIKQGKPTTKAKVN